MMSLDVLTTTVGFMITFYRVSRPCLNTVQIMTVFVVVVRQCFNNRAMTFCFHVVFQIVYIFTM